MSPGDKLFFLGCGCFSSQIGFILLIGQFDWLFLFYKMEFGIPDHGFGYFNTVAL